MDEKKIKVLLGKQVRHLRKAQGLTQEEASEKAGTITEKRWSDIERGRYDIGLTTLVKIAKGLNVALQELFKFEEINSKNKKSDILLKKISRLEKQTVKVDKEMEVLRKEIRGLKKPLE